MTVYTIDVAGWKPALAIIAAHGATDLDSWNWIGHYAVWGLVPVPSPVVTSTFCASSVVHFAEDNGPWLSVAVHAGVGLIGARYGKDVAFKSMMGYLLLWHTPHHYVRCWRRNRLRALFFAGVATVATLLTCNRLPNRFTFDNGLQRIVIAHISHEVGVRLHSHGFGSTKTNTLHDWRFRQAPEP